jgi:predicted acyltransferase
MQQRYYALDVFRGATVALMILVNNPGSWGAIFPPLDHAEWHGCTPTDLVFPFFLFAVGNAMAFVMPRFEQQGPAVFYRKVIKRTLLIFLIGLLLNWSPFFKWQNNELVFKPWAFVGKDGNGNFFEDGVRIMGVLQRIALAYCLASVVVYYAKARGAFVTAVVLLLGYWVVCMLAGTGDPYSMTGFCGRNIDISLLGKPHMLHVDKVDGKVFHFDYEGLAGTLPAVAQVIFGYLVSHYIQQKGKSWEMLSQLLVAGIILLVAGLCWSVAFPLNKKIWSSSYVVYTTGLAIITLGILIYLLEFKNRQGAWSHFFDVFGKNPLFIFVLSGFLPRLAQLIRIPEDGHNLTPFGWFYEHVCKNVSTDARIGSLLYAILLLLFYWLIVYWLNKRKIYIKV